MSVYCVDILCPAVKEIELIFNQNLRFKLVVVQHQGPLLSEILFFCNDLGPGLSTVFIDTFSFPQVDLWYKT